MAMHVTLKGEMYKYGYDMFQHLPGSVVVRHMEGLVQKERPHYHIWWPTDLKKSHATDVIKQYVRSKDATFADKNGNALYSCTPHDSFTRWLDYTIDPMKAKVKKPEIMVWNLPDPKPEVRSEAQLILPALSVEVLNTVSSTEKKKSKRNRGVEFYNYMIDKYVGVKDVISQDRIKREFWRWSEYGFQDFQAIAIIRNTWYQLNKDFPEILQKEEDGWANRVKIFSADYV